MKSILFSLFFLFSIFLHAQVFIPFGHWAPKKQVTLRCEAGCYPTPNTPFTAALYYVPTSSSATFKAISTTNPSGYDFCFGPTNALGCAANAFGGGVTYPLSCAPAGNGDTMDGSSVDDQADYLASATNNQNSTCTVTDYGESQATAIASITAFTPVTVSSPVTTLAAPQIICVGQTQAITGAGGLVSASKAWSVISGGGSVSPLTGNSTTFTAPATAQSVQVQLQDPTTLMSVITYLNVISTIALTPTVTVETPVNSSTFMQDPTTSAGTNLVANLNIKANCGLANYTAGVTGGGSVTPTAGIANNAIVNFIPAAVDSTSTVTFTDSTPVTPQTSTLSIKSIVPVDITSNWGYHVCAKYSHSSYTAGTYKVKCWGLATGGRLGSGSTSNHLGNAPTELGTGLLFLKNTGTTGADMLVKDISVGWTHTCAILSNDTVKCWGLNASGQLGYDNTTTLSSPSASTVNIGAGTPKKIFAAGDKTCLIFSDDRLKCWGKNTNGELGQDNTLNYGGTTSIAGLGYISVAGSQVTVQKVALSEFNTCVLTTSAFAPGASKIYCWGYGNSAGMGSCTTSGTVNCGELGVANSGPIGNGGANLMSGLTAVNLSLGGGEAPIDISAGRKHFCVILAVSPAISGNVLCWGYNSSSSTAGGHLGINSATLSVSPPVTRAVTITNAIAVNMMTRSSCAILVGGAAKCWGRANNGQNLQGNTINYGTSAVANAMSGLANMNFGTGRTVKKMATGFYFGCAILDNDFIKCWGAQYCGTGTSTVNQGCLLSGISAALDNNAGAPTMMDSRYIGDGAGENGDNLPYIND